VRTADPSADGRRSAANRTAIGGGISSRLPRGDTLLLALVCVQAILVVGLASLLDSDMAAGLLYVVSVPGGGLGYLVATLHSSAEARTVSATLNFIATYLVLRTIIFCTVHVTRCCVNLQNLNILITSISCR